MPELPEARGRVDPERDEALDRAKAEAALESGRAALIAFGVPFIANPDLPRRLKDGAELAAPRQELFYAPGAEGYTDYPPLG